MYPISRGTPITLRSGSLKHDSKWWFTTNKGLSAKTEKKKNCSKDSHDEILHWAADCLRNPELRQQLLADSHPQMVYVALWAIGFYNTDEAWVVANQLIKDRRSQSKEVVLSYYQNHWAKESLEEITRRINQQK